jgi:hypothetical protein
MKTMASPAKKVASPAKKAAKNDQARDPDKEWCWACKRFVPIEEFTLGGRHDEDKGGCGCYWSH